MPLTGWYRESSSAWAEPPQYAAMKNGKRRMMAALAARLSSILQTCCNPQQPADTNCDYSVSLTAELATTCTTELMKHHPTLCSASVQVSGWLPENGSMQILTGDMHSKTPSRAVPRNLTTAYTLKPSSAFSSIEEQCHEQSLSTHMEHNKRSLDRCC